MIQLTLNKKKLLTLTPGHTSTFLYDERQESLDSPEDFTYTS